MAAPKENLLSLGHLTGAERNTFTKQRGHSLKQRPLLFKADFSTLQNHQHLKVMHLQQRWLELKERERTAQQHNRQLLQQFDKAQDTLREMLACNAAMKTIRMEYERYLEESAPRWQQQLKEKTQAAQKKRMEEYLRSCLKNTEDEQMTKSSADRLLLSQGLSKKTQTVSSPQEINNRTSHSDHNQDVSSHLPYTLSSWLTHTQSQAARFPCQPRGSSQIPPSYPPPRSTFPHPLQFQPHHLAPGHHRPWPMQDPPDWASPQPDHPWPWTAGAAGIPSGSEALWGRLYTEEPPHERGVEAETSRATSSRRERGGGSRSSHLSQELDIKPVRLSSGHGESSESGRDSSRASGEKRKRREKRRRDSSDRERRSSQDSSTTSSAVVIAGVAAIQSSESDASSEKCSTRGSRRTTKRSGGHAAGSPEVEREANERSRSRSKSKAGDSGSHKEESPSTGEESGSHTEESRGENAENQSPADKSDSDREDESDRVSIKTEKGAAEREKQESGCSAEQSSAEEKDEEEEEQRKDLGEGDGGDGEEKENSEGDEEQEERDVEEDDDGVSVGKDTSGDEEETGAEDELEDQGDDEDRLKNGDGENRELGSASSQDEEVDEGESERDENKGEDEEGPDEEEDGEGEEEEEQMGDEAGEPEEESDSEDSIISPQENRPKKMHVIPEEAAEDDDDDDDEEEKGSETGSSDENSNEFSEDDNIENLLAPQEQRKKEEKDPKADDKPKVTCDIVEIFQAEQDNSTKTDHQSDSDEFDHFYD